MEGIINKLCEKMMPHGIYAAISVNMLFACYFETEINCEPEPEPEPEPIFNALTWCKNKVNTHIIYTSIR